MAAAGVRKVILKVCVKTIKYQLCSALTCPRSCAMEFVLRQVLLVNSCQCLHSISYLMATYIQVPRFLV